VIKEAEAVVLEAGAGVGAGALEPVGPGMYCSPHLPTHVLPSSLQLHGTL